MHANTDMTPAGPPDSAGATDQAVTPVPSVDEPEISPTRYRQMTGEDLKSTLDISTWDTGVRALQAFERLEREVEQAERYSNEIRQAVRKHVFELLPNVLGAPREAGVYRANLDDLRSAQKNVLFNGLVEACDGNSHIFYTVPIQIIQIAVAAITYHGEESTWANRIFRRDIPLKGGADILQETIDLLSRRAEKEHRGGRRVVTDMMRRAVMTYMERIVLADRAQAPWRMGHGNPLAYELLTGSGQVELIGYSVDVLRRLVLEHKKFVFVPSESNAEHLLTIGDALHPLEYAIVNTAVTDLEKLMGGGFRGEWKGVLTNTLEPFCVEAGPVVLTGVFRASAMAPAQMFYAHRDYIHEAALIAMADSVMQEHRGRPMLLDMADGLCKTYFGAETLSMPAQSAFAQSGEPYRYLDERVTRA
jgi:hypothetical protein